MLGHESKDTTRILLTFTGNFTHGSVSPEKDVFFHLHPVTVTAQLENKNCPAPRALLLGAK